MKICIPIYYAPAMTMAGAKSVTPVRPSVRNSVYTYVRHTKR